MGRDEAEDMEEERSKGRPGEGSEKRSRRGGGGKNSRPRMPAYFSSRLCCLKINNAFFMELLLHYCLLHTFDCYAASIRCNYI